MKKHYRAGAAIVFVAAAVVGLALELRPEELKGVRIEPQADRCAALVERIQKAPAAPMSGPGLAGVMGGASVKVLYPFSQELMLPLPQLASGQVPITFFMRSEPSDAVAELRLWDRGEGNIVLRVRLVGKRQDVKLEWAAVVLLAPSHPARTVKESTVFEKATDCVQSEAKDIKNLAADLWPATGKATDYASSIQQHISGMKRKERPSSLDALGILKSGENSICTSNANLAAALLRAKGVPCRSVAVVPPIGVRLEMHRVVEFSADGQWRTFDPSSLTRDIPAKPWQNIVMARTTIEDEEAAMKPRMGAMVGCPYGQELELLTQGVTLFGQDFFWTMAKPLAEFTPADEAMRTARDAWEAFLKSGSLRREQIAASTATTADAFAKQIKSP